MTDRFDEGLMVLRRLLGWSMIDMTYMKLNETKAGSQWQSEGNRFVDRPSFDDLPEQASPWGYQGDITRPGLSSTSSNENRNRVSPYRSTPLFWLHLAADCFVRMFSVIPAGIRQPRGASMTAMVSNACPQQS